MKYLCVYILVSQWNGMFYIGVIGQIVECIVVYWIGKVLKFIVKYGVVCFVWYEFYQDFFFVIVCEKCLKVWKCVWKINLIEENNLDWDDFFEIIQMWVLLN